MIALKQIEFFLSTFDNLQERYNQLVKREKQLEEQIKVIETAYNFVRDYQNSVFSAIAENLSETVSLGLEYVFKKRFKFGSSAQKRGVSLEISLGNVSSKNPIHSFGGGVIDAASLLARLALSPYTGKLLILDEPCKMLSTTYSYELGRIISDFVHQKGVQVIIASHNRGLIDSADKVIDITKGE